MTDREILSNAIDKAIANGMPLQELVHYPAIALIYRHPFAKAFWGTEHIEKTNDNLKCDDPHCAVWWEGPAWQWHLMEMVRKENPIKYLEKFL